MNSVLIGRCYKDINISGVNEIKMSLSCFALRENNKIGMWLNNNASELMWIKVLDSILSNSKQTYIQINKQMEKGKTYLHYPGGNCCKINITNKTLIV